MCWTYLQSERWYTLEFLAPAKCRLGCSRASCAGGGLPDGIGRQLVGSGGHGVDRGTRRDLHHDIPRDVVHRVQRFSPATVFRPVGLDSSLIQAIKAVPQPGGGTYCHRPLKRCRSSRRDREPSFIRAVGTAMVMHLVDIDWPDLG